MCVCVCVCMHGSDSAYSKLEGTWTGRDRESGIEATRGRWIQSERKSAKLREKVLPSVL